MLAKIIFFVAVSAAIASVILLALLSPPGHKKYKDKPSSWLALSLYIQPPHLPNRQHQAETPGSEAFIFRHTLTEGPKNTSQVIGKAQGFIIPVEHFAHSPFNIIYLSFNTPEYTGSLSVEAKQMKYEAKEELTVVGGTGSFAFARGLAIFVQNQNYNLNHRDGLISDTFAMYHLQLRLKFPA
ncbi:hypothetical protein J5N97_024600 [Dioscorea zingiberensis]|uniref:Dirigent protein n=1 Tax=Dioscorea zingiberensis TaxID=325984 RepID=A0A9D5H973_9LILI|nr:hypothetical protein J5N97_024600 [Dioscorea zingiberensis]